MLQNNYLDMGVGQRGFHTFTWRNYRNEPSYILTVKVERPSSNEMRLYLSSTGQIVYFHSTALNFGGVRWWFHCLGCERRCAKLYRGPGFIFLCRICHDLTYESCIDGKSTASFLAQFCAQRGLCLAEMKRAIAEDTRSRNKWKRKTGQASKLQGAPARDPRKEPQKGDVQSESSERNREELGRIAMS